MNEYLVGNNLSGCLHTYSLGHFSCSTYCGNSLLRVLAMWERNIISLRLGS